MLPAMYQVMLKQSLKIQSKMHPPGPTPAAHELRVSRQLLHSLSDPSTYSALPPGQDCLCPPCGRSVHKGPPSILKACIHRADPSSFHLLGVIVHGTFDEAYK